MCKSAHRCIKISETRPSMQFYIRNRNRTLLSLSRRPNSKKLHSSTPSKRKHTETGKHCRTWVNGAAFHQIRNRDDTEKEWERDCLAERSKALAVNALYGCSKTQDTFQHSCFLSRCERWSFTDINVQPNHQRCRLLISDLFLSLSLSLFCQQYHWFPKIQKALAHR